MSFRRPGQLARFSEVRFSHGTCAIVKASPGDFFAGVVGGQKIRLGSLECLKIQ